MEVYKTFEEFYSWYVSEIARLVPAYMSMPAERVHARLPVLSKEEQVELFMRIRDIVSFPKTIKLVYYPQMETYFSVYNTDKKRIEIGVPTVAMMMLRYPPTLNVAIRHELGHIFNRDIFIENNPVHNQCINICMDVRINAHLSLENMNQVIKCLFQFNKKNAEEIQAPHPSIMYPKIGLPIEGADMFDWSTIHDFYHMKDDTNKDMDEMMKELQKILGGIPEKQDGDEGDGEDGGEDGDEKEGEGQQGQQGQQKGSGQSGQKGEGEGEGEGSQGDQSSGGGRQGEGQGGSGSGSESGEAGGSDGSGGEEKEGQQGKKKGGGGKGHDHNHEEGEQNSGGGMKGEAAGSEDDPDAKGSGDGGADGSKEGGEAGGEEQGDAQSEGDAADRAKRKQRIEAKQTIKEIEKTIQSLNTIREKYNDKLKSKQGTFITQKIKDLEILKQQANQEVQNLDLEFING